MTMLYIVSAVLTCVILYQGVYMYHMQEAFQKHNERLHKEWQQERKDLYNRIQASNYAEYTASEVKKIRVEKEEPQPKFNLL